MGKFISHPSVPLLTQILRVLSNFLFSFKLFQSMSKFDTMMIKQEGDALYPDLCTLRTTFSSMTRIKSDIHQLNISEPTLQISWELFLFLNKVLKLSHVVFLAGSFQQLTFVVGPGTWLLFNTTDTSHTNQNVAEAPPPNPTLKSDWLMIKLFLESLRNTSFFVFVNNGTVKLIYITWI